MLTLESVRKREKERRDNMMKNLQRNFDPNFTIWKYMEGADGIMIITLHIEKNNWAKSIINIDIITTTLQ